MQGEREVLNRFRAAVDAEMTARYGISWADAAGDEEPLLAAIRRGEGAARFVLWFGEKYDLVPRSEWSLGLLLREAAALAASGGPNVLSVIPHGVARLGDSGDD